MKHVPRQPHDAAWHRGGLAERGLAWNSMNSREPAHSRPRPLEAARQENGGRRLPGMAAPAFTSMAVPLALDFRGVALVLVILIIDSIFLELIAQGADADA
jgi:hypothetical protein